MSKALNPSVSNNTHEAQSAVHVELKPGKQRNQRHRKSSRVWAGEGVSELVGALSPVNHKGLYQG